MPFLFLFSFLAIGSCPFSSISVSFCLLDWVLLLSFSPFFSCFLISFILSFAPSLLASHCWEAIVFSASLIYFKSFFKFSISSFVEEMILFSLVFVFFFYCLLSTALFWRLGPVGDTKTSADVFNKMLLNAAKCQGYSFYLLKAIKGKPTEG